MSFSRYAPLLIKQVVQSKTCNKSIWNFLSVCVTSIATIAWDFSNYRKIGQSFDRGKSFLLDFWLGCECSSAESYIFRSIHLEVFRKIASLKGFSKFLEKFFWRSPFQTSYRPKTGLLNWFYFVRLLLLKFFKLLHWELFRVLWYPCPSSF